MFHWLIPDHVVEGNPSLPDARNGSNLCQWVSDRDDMKLV